MACALALALAALAACSPQKAAQGGADAGAKPIPLLSAEDFQKQAQWRGAIAVKAAPKKGCFTAAYPSTEWKEAPCVDAPNYPMSPKSGVVPFTVGNGDDVAAQAPSGHISSTTGSFDSATGVTSETGPIGNAGASHADTYTLQINTDFFTTTTCATSPNANCRGWEQFVFENNPNAHRAFIQYWLVNFDGACPANFQSFPLSAGHNHCVQLTNTLGAVNTTPVPVTNLTQVSLTGNATAGADSITMTIGGQAFQRNGDNSVNASTGWTISEFNILGDGGDSNGVGGTASFNNGAGLVARTRIIYGGNAAPNCLATGFTAEKNNLSFGPSAPVGTQPGPAVIFSEATTGGLANCAAATTVGDTHMTTLSGLYYDFQATGDFDLIRTSTGFVVQARQVSGAPTWPNAAVNSAIGVQVGRTRAAVCLAPTRLVVDGHETPLAEGAIKQLPDGTEVALRGGAYYVRGEAGDWVKANVVGSHIDVSVGLGRWPVQAQGLLVNAGNNAATLATRQGAVIKTPFSFEEFYHRYGESWRAKQSLLDQCGGRAREQGIPAKPFTARDLEPQLAQRVRGICNEAGVKEGPLLDACMIDVAFTGDKTAALVHAHTRPPVAVGVFAGAGGGKGGKGGY